MTKQKLDEEQVDALTAMALITQSVKEATGRYLGQIAVREWGYKEGVVLEFNYDLEKKQVEVTEVKDEAKE